MTCLGELSVKMPVTGSFQAYATKYIGPASGKVEDLKFVAPFYPVMPILCLVICAMDATRTVVHKYRNKGKKQQRLLPVEKLVRGVLFRLRST
jgi:amino acid permease